MAAISIPGRDCSAQGCRECTCRNRGRPEEEDAVHSASGFVSAENCNPQINTTPPARPAGFRGRERSADQHDPGGHGHRSSSQRAPAERQCVAPDVHRDGARQPGPDQRPERQRRLYARPGRPDGFHDRDVRPGGSRPGGHLRDGIGPGREPWHHRRHHPLAAGGQPARSGHDRREPALRRRCQLAGHEPVGDAPAVDDGLLHRRPELQRRRRRSPPPRRRSSSPRPCPARFRPAKRRSSSIAGIGRCSTGARASSPPPRSRPGRAPTSSTSARSRPPSTRP